MEEELLDLKRLKRQIILGWCGLVDSIPACKPNGCQFDSQSGHMSGLWARSSVGGVLKATD